MAGSANPSRLLRSLAGAAMAVAASGPAAGSDEPVREGCYGAAFDRAEGPIRELTVRLTRPEPDAGMHFRVAFTEWDAPNQSFDFSTQCRTIGNRLQCVVACAGGAAVLRREGSALLFEARGLLYGATGDGTLLSPAGSDGGGLHGIFRLTGRTGDETCLPRMEHAVAELAAGDISPRVETAESMLNALGYLLEFPDPVFDEATRAAVAAFQARAGLEATGRIDADTALTLEAIAKAEGSC